MIFISVDLPAPFSPTSPWISPAPRTKSISRSAIAPPNAFETPPSSSSGVIGGPSDEELLLHPHHARRIGLGNDRAIGDDVLRNAARAGLLAVDDRGDAGDQGPAMDAAGGVSHGSEHPPFLHRGQRRRHGVAAADQDAGPVMGLHHVIGS